MTPQRGEQTIAIHILSNISRQRKGKKTRTFGQVTVTRFEPTDSTI